MGMTLRRTFIEVNKEKFFKKPKVNENFTVFNSIS